MRVQNYTKTIFESLRKESILSATDKVGGGNKNDNCQVEFGYAQRKKSASKMIAVPMEPRCKGPADWSGPVGMILGGELYVSDFAYNIDACPELYEDNIRKLAERITTLCNRL